MAVSLASQAPFASFTVIGLGLIGGSLAMAARQCYSDKPLFAVDANGSTRDFALRHHIADEAFTRLEDARPALEKLWAVKAPELDRKRPDLHLVVLACHLSQNLGILRELAPMVQGRPVLVMDIGSCKREIAKLAEGILPTQFVPGHPMAGKASSGIQNATDLLFVNKAFLLSPLPATPQSSIQQLENFIQAIGGLPRILDAVVHDRAMAYVSHLPQAYAILLADLLSRNEPETLLNCYGGGLDDQLRLAASPYAMWGDIFQQNGDHIRSALTQLRDLIDDVLAESGSSGWGKRFVHANAVEQQFQKAKKTGAGNAPVIESAS